MSNVKGESDVNPTESETTSMVGNFPNGSREIPAVSNSSMELDRSGKARCHNPDMHASGKSDKCVVPEKSANLDGLPPYSESMEERHLTNEKAEHKSLDRAQNRNTDGKPSRPRSRGQTFDFLGFTHICGETLKGNFTVHRRTSGKKDQTKLKD